MFLSRRVTQEEYIDKPGLPVAVVVEHYRQLRRVNQLFRYTDPFKLRLPEWVGEVKGRPVSILDIGAGDGSLGEELRAWATAQGWEWSFTNLDINPLPLRFAPGGGGVAASALALPFPANSFDVVISSQMIHHLDRREQVVQHFREAWRVTRDVLLFSDLHRNVGLYALVWLFLRFLPVSRPLYLDGLISVRRGWRRREWEQLAAEAGLVRAEVWLYFGARIILQARKSVLRSANGATTATIARYLEVR